MNNLITIKEVQTILGVGKDWIYGRIKTGELVSYKLGRYIRFQISDVEALLANSRNSNETSYKVNS